MDTLGSIRQEIVGFLRGDYDSDDDIPVLNACINDAIEKVWTSIAQVQLARLIGSNSPVTFTLGAEEERVQLINVADPLTGPTLASVAGGNIGGRTVHAAFTYVTESGSETLPSPTVDIVLGANVLLTAVLPNQANVKGAIGWNLYTSTDPDQVLALQNQQPLQFKQTYQEPPTGIIDYAAAQQTVPVANRTADNIAWIKHMEIRTSDTLLRAWNQADIDSMLFRQFARTLSSASEYQAYIWDLIDGSVLEFRPTAGLTLNPRYWYVEKPRRLRYDQAEIKVVKVTAAHEALVAHSVAKLKLAQDEYLAMQGWLSVAGDAEMRMKLALNQENWSKDVRVAPHLY